MASMPLPVSLNSTFSFIALPTQYIYNQPGLFLYLFFFLFLPVLSLLPSLLKPTPSLPQIHSSGIHFCFFIIQQHPLFRLPQLPGWVTTYPLSCIWPCSSVASVFILTIFCSFCFSGKSSTKCLQHDLPWHATRAEKLPQLW